MTQEWRPDSWRLRRAMHQPDYDNPQALHAACERLSRLPALVSPVEVDRLREDLARAGRGEAFVLHGGDCVERFEDCREERISNKLKIMLQMSTVLTYAARRPVVRIGRIAGQYFKPRSQATERVGELELPTYRGDTVNEFAATAESRRPDAGRLVEGYFHASATLNYIRAGIAGGLADLHHPYSWNLHSIESLPDWTRYRRILDRIIDAVTFMESFGGLRPEIISSIDFSTSHEGLHLPYEEALTRRLPDGRWMNLGAHFLWIGDRTRGIEDAHVEYFRGIANPIGVKLGPAVTRDDLLRLVERLDPEARPGRLTLISRFGEGQVIDRLGPLVESLVAEGRHPVWCCDPMHGNTEAVSGGTKTRRFEAILQELRSAFAVHRRVGAGDLAGVHFELTGEEVTECIGGGSGLEPADLTRNYESYCDPRLNYAQSMEMAFLIAEHIRGGVGTEV